MWSDDIARRERLAMWFKIGILFAGIGMLLVAAYLAGYSSGLTDGAMKAFEYAQKTFHCIIPIR